MRSIVPTDEEILAVLNLYGDVAMTDKGRVMLRRTSNSITGDRQLTGQPMGMYNLVVSWMWDTVKAIEGEVAKITQ